MAKELDISAVSCQLKWEEDGTLYELVFKTNDGTEIAKVALSKRTFGELSINKEWIMKLLPVAVENSDTSGAILQNLVVEGLESTVVQDDKNVDIGDCNRLDKSTILNNNATHEDKTKPASLNDSQIKDPVSGGQCGDSLNGSATLSESESNSDLESEGTSNSESEDTSNSESEDIQSSDSSEDSSEDFKKDILEEYESLKNYGKQLKMKSSNKVILVYKRQDGNIKHMECDSKVSAYKEAYKLNQNNELKDEFPTVHVIKNKSILCEKEDKTAGGKTTVPSPSVAAIPRRELRAEDTAGPERELPIEEITETDSNDVKPSETTDPYIHGFLQVPGCEPKAMKLFVDSGAYFGSVDFQPNSSHFKNGIFTVTDINEKDTPMLIASVSLDRKKFSDLQLFDVDMDCDNWNAIGMVDIKKGYVLLIPGGETLFFPECQYSLRTVHDVTTISPIHHPSSES